MRRNTVIQILEILLPFLFGLSGFLFSSFRISSNLLILISIGIVISLLLEIIRELLPKENVVTVQFKKGQKEILDYAKLMRSDARKTCDFTWIGSYPSTQDHYLSKYFDEEVYELKDSTQGLHLRRLINKNHWGIDLEEHMKNHADLIANGKYEIKSTDFSEFDLAIADYSMDDDTINRRAMLIILDSEMHPHLGICFDDRIHYENKEIIRTMEKIFERFWKSADEIKFPEEGS